jgi:polyisoprenoid-binding protein YceI
MRKTVAVLTGLALAAPAFAADAYDVDVAHSTIGFSARHMVVASTKGSFTDYVASFEVDSADFTTLKATANIEAKSINTADQKRDDHLRGPDFFEVEKYPEIRFDSTKVEKKGKDYVLSGNLTMKETTKEIAIPIAISGPITDPWGNERIGFEGSTKINRKDWGINWSKLMDNGGLVVSDEIKIDISIEGIKRK